MGKEPTGADFGTARTGETTDTDEPSSADAEDKEGEDSGEKANPKCPNPDGSSNTRMASEDCCEEEELANKCKEKIEECTQTSTYYFHYDIEKCECLWNEGILKVVVDTKEGYKIDKCGDCHSLDDQIEDEDNDGTPDKCDRCPIGNDNDDDDGDGVPNACDACDKRFYPCASDCDVSLDDDGDNWPNCVDVCPLGDDHIDTDKDGIPDACDRFDNRLDSDEDGVYDHEDKCEGYDDNIDSDSDGVPDGCDCEGGELDCDGICNGPNVKGPCGCTPSGDNPDEDGDGVYDCNDICPGHNDKEDSDGDGVPDGCDHCPGIDNRIDENKNDIPDCYECSSGTLADCENCEEDIEEAEKRIDETFSDIDELNQEKSKAANELRWLLINIQDCFNIDIYKTIKEIKNCQEEKQTQIDQKKNVLSDIEESILDKEDELLKMYKELNRLIEKCY